MKRQGRLTLPSIFNGYGWIRFFNLSTESRNAESALFTGVVHELFRNILFLLFSVKTEFLW
jgi:hypothetical protein